MACAWGRTDCKVPLLVRELSRCGSCGCPMTSTLMSHCPLGSGKKFICFERLFLIDPHDFFLSGSFTAALPLLGTQ